MNDGLLAQQNPQNSNTAPNSNQAPRQAPQRAADDALQMPAIKKTEGPLIGAALSEMSTQDAFAIINPNGPYVSIAQSMYKDHQEQHPDSKISESEFIDELKALPVAEMLQRTEEYLQGNGKGLLSRYTDIVEIVSSEEFKECAEILQKELGLKSASKPNLEVFSLLKAAPNEVQERLGAIATPEFRQFHAMIRNEYGINPNNNLATVVDSYLSPEALSYYESAATQRAFKAVSEVFGMKGENITEIAVAESLLPFRRQALTLNDVSVEQLTEMAQQVKQDLQGIERIYGERYAVSSLGQISSLMRFAKEELTRLNTDQSKEIYAYFKNAHPEAIEYESVFRLVDSLHGFHDEYVESLRRELQLDVSELPKLDAFLAVFGSDLGAIDLERSYLFQRNGVAIASYFENAEFQKYAKKLVAEYPALKDTVSIETVYEVIQAYENRDAVAELHAARQGLQDIQAEAAPLSLPALHLEHIQEHTQILKELTRQGFRNITIDGVEFAGEGSNRLVLDADGYATVLEAIRDGSAKELYDSLRNDWKVEEIGLTGFLQIISKSPEQREEFSKENAAKFQEIVSLYRISDTEPNSDPSKEGGYSRASLSLQDVNLYGEDIVKRYDTLRDPNVRELLKEYRSHMFTTLDGGEEVFAKLSEFSDYSSGLTRILANPKGFAKAAEVLHQEFDIPKDRVLEVIPRDGVTEEFLASIQNPELRDTVEWLKNDIFKGRTTPNYAGEETPISARGYYYLARQVLDADNANLRELIAPLEEMGVEMHHGGVMQFVTERLLPRPGVVEHLKDPEFRSFVTTMTDNFYGGTADVTKLGDLSDLYGRIANDEHKLALLQSDTFQDTLSFIRSELNVTQLHPSTLATVLQVADGFKKEEMQQLIKTLEGAQGVPAERITPNDLVLLSEILDSKPLHDRLFDGTSIKRQELVSDVKKFYAETTDIVVRDRVAEYDEAIQEAKKSGALPDSIRLLEEKREEVRVQFADYTERPKVDELSTLQLLRISLLKDNLAQEKDSVMREIGRVVYDDVHDKTTEHGGTIQLEGDTISFSEVFSHSEFDGSYYNSQYQYMVDGIASFHLHALSTDNSKYAGPSGWLDTLSGDIRYVEAYDKVDVVITTLGHPRDSANKEIRDQLKVNIDMYYVDESNPREPKVRVIDLGTRTVPFRP